MSAHEQFIQLVRDNYDLTPTTVETHAVPDKGWTVTTVEPVMPNYNVRTSNDRLDEIDRELAALRAEMRSISEQMQASR